MTTETTHETTHETTQHTFTAPVQSLGKQQRGDGWDLVLDWRLPGSKYDLLLYGQEWADVSGFNIGYAATWTIQRGNLKNEKDGTYASDYFWNWDPQATPSSADADEPFAGKPEPGQERGEKPNAGIQVEGVVQGHLEKLAVDLYNTELIIGEVAEGEPDYLRIRKIRDNLYHQVKEKPIQHEHYCYEHETLCQKGNTGYGHRVNDGWCIEGKGILPDTKLDEETESENGPRGLPPW